MRNVWWFVLCGSVLSGRIFGLTPLWAEPVRWQVLSTPDLQIYYSTGQSALAHQVADQAEKSLKTLQGRLRISPSRRMHIYLYPKHRIFLKDVGTDPHLLVVGLAYGQGDTIRVDASGLFEKVHLILAHEMVHLLLHKALNGNMAQMPLWMNEGLAKYLTEGWFAPSDERLADAVVRGRLIPLQELYDRFPADPDANALAYAQGTSFVAYLDTLYGEDAIPRLIGLLEAGYGLHRALLEVFGSSLKELEEHWKAYLRQQYRWTPWANIAPWAIGMVFVALFLVAYRTLLRRRRLLVAKWEMEERQEEGPNEIKG